jgi:hypothetical protein
MYQYLIWMASSSNLCYGIEMSPWLPYNFPFSKDPLREWFRNFQKLQEPLAYFWRQKSEMSAQHSGVTFEPDRSFAHFARRTRAQTHFYMQGIRLH